ncbi:MAG: J domain-containing protein [Methylococcaceae bacterium]
MTTAREDSLPICEIDTLSLQLAAILDNLEQMQHKEKPYLLALYQTRLGEVEYHLLNLQVECRVLPRRIELAVALLNRGEMLTRQILDGIEAQVTLDLLVWQTYISQQAQALSAGRKFFSGLVMVDANTLQRAKKAYRRLVRLLHPDVSPQHQELFDHYWQAVQDAYGNIDADLLEALRHIVETAVSQCPNQADNHAETIFRLNALIASHSERLITLKTEVPFCWSEQLHDPEWLSARQASLEAAIVVESEGWAKLVSRHAKIVAQVG